MEGYKRVALTKDRLREAMRLRGLKQADLVRDTGLNRGTISRYLSGEVEPRMEASHKLAVALCVNEMWLGGYAVPMERTSEAKRNDQLVALIAKMRKDPDFFEVVALFSELPPEQYASIKQLVLSLGNK